MSLLPGSRWTLLRRAFRARGGGAEELQHRMVKLFRPFQIDEVSSAGNDKYSCTLNALTDPFSQGYVSRIIIVPSDDQRLRVNL